ncbi:NUDIX hydrolase [Gilvimarinus gilvus]|uniref:NUDIX hydrolase n=1 Tax=Gilvimarinus gilvus TaxID=3058038 RepID=UPI0026741207|nr:NUDIX pyrophosphatase [Gilvimarinus sp. SDUM040013]
MRDRYQVLVFSYFKKKSGLRYLILKRSDNSCWQGIAGGGEMNESPLEAARREAFEEAGIPMNANYISLDSMCTVPIRYFPELASTDGSLVIPEYAFGVESKTMDVCLSIEHTEYTWSSYEEAVDKLKWDSNVNALWELHTRLNQ